MPLTPVEIRNVELRRRFFRGYRGSAVDRLLHEIADSFEEVWRERADLTHRLDELVVESSRQRELEALLRSTLVSAERASQDLKEQARRESDLIVREAHAEARRIAREAAAEKHRLEQEIRTIGARLRAALESLEKEKEREQESEPEVGSATMHVDEVTGSGIRKIAG